MSNPTELPELDRLLDRASKIADWLSNAGLPQSAADVATLGALARHAQPDGEAPQAELMADANRYAYLASTADWSAIEDLLRRSDAESATELKRDLDKLIDAQLKTAITLPLYTARAAQHAESGAPAAIPTWQERMPKPRRAYTCDMNCSRDRRHESPTSCGDCMPVTVHGDPVKARDAEIADLRAALAAKSQGAPAVPAGLTRYSMWSNSTAHGMDASPTGQWVSFDELRDALTSQQAVAPGALLEILRDVHDTLASESDSDIDHFGDDDEEREGAPVQYAARKVMEVMDMLKAGTPSAPGTPEAPGLPGQSDEEAYASSGYRHFMSLDTFKAFRAECANRAAQLDGGQGEGERHADQA